MPIYFVYAIITLYKKDIKSMIVTGVKENPLKSFPRTFEGIAPFKTLSYALPLIFLSEEVVNELVHEVRSRIDADCLQDI